MTHRPILDSRAKVAAFAVLAGIIALSVIVLSGWEAARTMLPDRRMPGYDHWMHERGMKP